jgi:amino-acid N-acetyltransferase
VWDFGCGRSFAAGSWTPAGSRAILHPSAARVSARLTGTAAAPRAPDDVMSETLFVSCPPAASVVRRARVSDAPEIQRLITQFADRDEMLHRSLGEIYENIRDFHVVEAPAGKAGPVRLVACGALHVCWSHLAEIKSLAVDEAHQGKGHGKALVLGCIEEARELELQTVFALTYKPEFFTRIGFRIVDKATLPHKVWNECIRCPKFPGCGEIAVVYELATARRPAAISLPVLD